jgi:uncharacterized repeat protein (TIGR04138 family)
MWYRKSSGDPFVREMRCDKCREKEPTIFLTQIIDGEMTKSSLCGDCGKTVVQGAISPQELLELLQKPSSGGRLFSNVFDSVALNDPDYAREAFSFVRDGVDRAARLISPGPAHVSAHELLDSLRLLAIERYGSGARKQLQAWGITRCEDFGEIVFRLIEHGVFGKRAEDNKEDFSDGYDFASAFPAATS